MKREVLDAALHVQRDSPEIRLSIVLNETVPVT